MYSFFQLNITINAMQINYFDGDESPLSSVAINLYDSGWFIDRVLFKVFIYIYNI